MGKFFDIVKATSKTIIGNYTVTRSVNTETTDGASGSKTDSFAIAAVLDCAFFKSSDDLTRAVQGDFESGGAILVLPVSDTTTSRGDKIVVTYVDSSTETYLVKHVEPVFYSDSKICELEFLE